STGSTFFSSGFGSGFFSSALGGSIGLGSGRICFSKTTRANCGGNFSFSARVISGTFTTVATILSSNITTKLTNRILLKRWSSPADELQGNSRFSVVLVISTFPTFIKRQFLFGHRQRNIAIISGGASRHHFFQNLIGNFLIRHNGDRAPAELRLFR